MKERENNNVKGEKRRGTRACKKGRDAIKDATKPPLTYDTQPHTRSKAKSMTTTALTSTHAKPTPSPPHPAHSIMIEERGDAGNPQRGRRRLSPAIVRLPQRAQCSRRQTASLALATLYAPRRRRYGYEVAKAKRAQGNEEGPRKEITGNGVMRERKRRKLKENEREIEKGKVTK